MSLVECLKLIDIVFAVQLRPNSHQMNKLLRSTFVSSLSQLKQDMEKIGFLVQRTHLIRFTLFATVRKVRLYIYIYFAR